jgi:YVTN family beta-propeller protein
MSDYAAIVSRRTFAAKTFPVGKKPYWSTNGVDGDLCWVSVSGDDRVVVLDYDTEREVARIPVGDHPQRVRVGAVRLAGLPGLPLAPGAKDGAPPFVRTARASSRCHRSSFVLHGTVADQSRVRSVEVTLRGRRLLRTSGNAFRVRVPFRGLPAGRHALVVRATDAAGNRQRSVVRFRRCAGAAQVRFTG